MDSVHFDIGLAEKKGNGEWAVVQERGITYHSFH